jgi:signal transduction histidine kinase/CheY-like chemotaxis protein
MTDRLRPIAAGLVVTALGLAAVAWVDRDQGDKRRKDLGVETEMAGRQFAARAEAALERHLVGIQQMANFWENSDAVRAAEFEPFAASTLELNPLCLRIVALDAGGTVRRVYPFEPNRSLIGFDVRGHREGYETFVRSRRTRKAALSAPLSLVGGARGFVVTAPIFRRGAFDGAVVCSFRVEDFFRALILPEVVDRYALSMRDGDTLLFGSAAAVISAIRSTESVAIAGRVWNLSIAPLPAVVSARVNGGRAALWTLGLLVCLLAGSGVAAATDRALSTARRLSAQGKAIEETRGRLDTAMQQLIHAEKMTALGELVSGVAHEINNPLATVLGYTQLALRQDMPPAARRYIETAADEAERAGGIVRNLLTFARKHAPERHYVDLNGIAERTLELKAYHFRAGQIALVQDLEPGLPETMLDRHQMQQVLLNLLNNAEHALSGVSGARTIRVATRATPNTLRLSVSDSGPGVPEILRRRVFEPFFTTKGEESGTGLGLSVCKGIVEEHGGAIWVEGEPGCGATFVVELPIATGRRAADSVDSGSEPSSVHSLRILVVDDEPAVRSFLVDLLQAKGHEVDTAADVPEAEQKIGAGEFDVIVSDMKMPHGSGKDVYAAALRRSPELGKRIVFTTGDGASAETQRFIRDTGAAVVLKPCRIQVIEAAIARVAGLGPINRETP